MRGRIISLFVMSLFILSCTLNKEKKEYKELKDSCNDSNLYQSIFSYELEHPAHFESKLDLAKLNLFAGNYSKAWEYLIRADGILKNSKNVKVSDSDLSSMYASFATLNLLSNDLEQASEYVKKAYAVPKYGANYGYLKGRIDFALKNSDSAWDVFEKTYKKFPEQISAEEIKTYMYLAADRKEYKKALDLLELYFTKGAFFPGLGLFASGIYEKNGNLERSVFTAFLDYEYQSCFTKQNDKLFVENLKNAITKAESEGHTDEMNALKAVIALYTDSEFPIIETDFFAYKYIYYKYKYLHSQWVPNDAKYYFSIENNMNTFPIYYWLIWEVVSKADIKNYSNWTSILEKILLLNRSIYTDKARIALGKIAGFSEKDAEKLLIPAEVQVILNNYFSTEDEDILNPIYNFISLNDNSYVYSALAILKSYSAQNPLFKKVLSAKADVSIGRLKERLLFILN